MKTLKLNIPDLFSLILRPKYKQLILLIVLVWFKTSQLQAQHIQGILLNDPLTELAKQLTKAKEHQGADHLKNTSYNKKTRSAKDYKIFEIDAEGISQEQTTTNGIRDSRLQKAEETLHQSALNITKSIPDISKPVKRVRKRKRL